MWTQETPSQEGTYLFRRIKRDSPEQVAIKGDKVVFRSGNIKDLANVKGQWSGPIELRKEPQEGKSESLKRAYNWLLAHAGKVVLGLFGSLVLGACRTSRIIKSLKPDAGLLHIGIMTRVPQQAGASV